MNRKEKSKEARRTLLELIDGESLSARQLSRRVGKPMNRVSPLLSQMFKERLVMKAGVQNRLRGLTLWRATNGWRSVVGRRKLNQSRSTFTASHTSAGRRGTTSESIGVDAAFTGGNPTINQGEMMNGKIGYNIDQGTFEGDVETMVEFARRLREPVKKEEKEEVVRRRTAPTSSRIEAKENVIVDDRDDRSTTNAKKFLGAILDKGKEGACYHNTRGKFRFKAHQAFAGRLSGLRSYIRYKKGVAPSKHADGLDDLLWSRGQGVSKRWFADGAALKRIGCTPA